MNPSPIIDLEFIVNDTSVRLRCEPTRRLLTMLREDLGLTGAKPGCGVGRCGACLVWLDGEPVNACLVMAYQIRGRNVTTIESVSESAVSEPVRQVLAASGAVQCGYCASGLVMMMTRLYSREPRPSASEASAELCGQICRCTGYGGLQRAIETLFPA